MFYHSHAQTTLNNMSYKIFLLGKIFFKQFKLKQLLRVLLNMPQIHTFYYLFLINIVFYVKATLGI